MAFGTTLANLRRLLRAEVGQSLNPAQGVNAQGQYDMTLDRVQKELWESYEWPHLTYYTTMPLADGQQLYTYPLSMPFDYIIQIYALIPNSNTWQPLTFPIMPEDYANYATIPTTVVNLLDGAPTTTPPGGPVDPGGGDTSPPGGGGGEGPPDPPPPDTTPSTPPVGPPLPPSLGQGFPPVKWANRPVVADGLTYPVAYMELLPIPNRNGTLMLKGQAPCNRLINDVDVAVLDDVLITLFAAAEILASQNAEHAAMKLQKANQYLRRHFANLGGGKRTIRALGGTGSYPNALPRARPGIDYAMPAG